MINTAVFVLVATLLILTLFLRYIEVKLAVPILLVMALLAIQPLPSILGYPVEERFVQGKEGVVLGGSGRTLMLMFKGESQPRLVILSDANKVQEALKKSKTTVVFIKFDKKSGKTKDGTSGETENEDLSSLQFVDGNDQTMVQKDP